MMFYVGDILIKVDNKECCLVGFDTQSHAMLIVGVNDTGYPLVAHMKFTDFLRKAGRLVIEPCPRAKDLFLIHSESFSEPVRAEIGRLARLACEQNLLRIDQDFLAAQYREAMQYRWSDRFQKPQKMQSLRAQPVVQSKILVDVEQMISCHDFVLSTIHWACINLGEAIPYGLNISGRFAWSDILYAQVQSDAAFAINNITRIRPPDRKAEAMHEISFFAQQQRAEKSSSEFSMRCVIS